MTGWIDAILGLMLLEGAALAAWHRRSGRGVPLPALLPNLLAGALLLLAMRCALTGAGPALVGACLFGGLLAHLGDLRIRWR